MDDIMSQTQTIAASGSVYNVTASDTLIYVTGDSGTVTVTGSNDTVISSASGIQLGLAGGSEVASVTGSNVTVNASGLGDAMSITGANNVVNDSGGFNDGVLLVAGQNATVAATALVETANVTISASNSSLYSFYLTGNFLLSGNNDTVSAGKANFTVAGSQDQLRSYRAASVDVTGGNDSVNIAAIPGAFGEDFSVLEGVGATTTVPGSVISVSGASDNVQTAVDNNTVAITGANDTIGLNSYNNEVSDTGSNTDLITESNNESVTVSGGNSTVTTNTTPVAVTSPTITASAPATSIVVTSSATGTVNDNNSNNQASITASTPVTVNLNVTQDSVTSASSSSSGSGGVLPANVVTNDYSGGNVFTINGASLLNAVAGADTVYVANGSYIDSDTLSGTAQTPNYVLIGSSTDFNTRVNGIITQNDVIQTTGNDNRIDVFGSSQDTVSVGGSGNVVIVDSDVDTRVVGGVSGTVTGSGSTPNVVDITGNNVLGLLYGYTSVNATNGVNISAAVPVYNASLSGGNNVILALFGEGNQVSLTGNDTVTDGSYWQYETNPFDVPAVQNQFTLQGGAATLGGLDQLTQTTGALDLTLYGGDSVTLNGQNDTVTAGDQVYGGNVIYNNAGNSTFNISDVGDAADTIVSSVSTDVILTDNTGQEAGVIKNTNTGQTFSFIGGMLTSNTINASASHTAITVSGAFNQYDQIYGGMGGNNSINGGGGGHDLFVAGGNNDVLIGGMQGSNTLVAATGSETLTGAGSGNLFSITGGGGFDLIQNFSGSLALKAGLTMTQETVVNGSLDILLNDGTQLLLQGVTSNLQQAGNVYTLS